MAPQFKKLTDCPENLREAIDWLIQIKNGGDGKGLGRLAEALKKLIADAIGNAYTTNVGALLKLLDSAKAYTCCKDTVAKIEELNKSEKAAENTFDNLKNYCESIRDCPKRHLDSSQQKSFGDIESKLDQLEKLKDSLTGFTNEEECKSLLTNLCDGLQTFLGFNSASKGYNGTGIVYSDLDRLCDAVMAFLHRVLESVKDDDAVKTYVINVGDFVVNTKESIGTGNKGLSDVVQHVSSLLSGWEHFVKQWTEAVITPLQHLEANIRNPKVVWSYEKSKPLSDQYNAWNQRAKEYVEKAMEANRGREKLDSQLKKKLEMPMKLIKQGVEGFQKICENRDLEILKSAAETELQILATAVKQYVRNRIKELESNLQRGFKSDVKTPVENITKKLNKIHTDLCEWVESAEDVVCKAIQKCDEILQRVDEKDPTDPETPIYKQAKELQDKAIALQKTTVAVKMNVEEHVKQALKTVNILDRAVRRGLKEAKDTIAGALRTYVKDKLLGDIKTKIGYIIRGERGSGIGLQKIKEKVEEYLGSFFKEGDTDGFGHIVEDWIKDILMQEPVVTNLNKYLTSHALKQGYTGMPKEEENYGQTIQQIASCFRTALKGDIKDAIVTASSQVDGDIQDDTDKIANYTTAVWVGCNQFYKLVGAKIQRDTMHSGISTDIATAIETGENGILADESHPTKDENLRSAVSSALHRLVAVAKQVGDQIQDFVEGCHLDKLVAALKVATGLESEVGKASSQPITSIEPIPPLSSDTVSIYNFEGRILGILNQELGDDDGDAGVTNMNSVHFEHYIKQISSPARNDGYPSGEFSATIERIESIGLAKLNDPDGIPEIMEFTTPFEAIMKQLTEITSLVGDTTGSGSLLKQGNIDKKGIKTLLDDLRKGLGNEQVFDVFSKGIGKLHRRILAIIGAESTVNTLMGTIAAATKFHGTTIKSAADVAVREINDHIQAEVEKTVKNIQNKAQMLYADRKEKDLHDLKLIVETETLNIHDIIRQDLGTGMKGLMQHLKHGITQFTRLPFTLTINNLSPKVEDFGDILLLYVQEQVKTSHETATKDPRKSVTKLASNPSTTSPTTDTSIQLGKIKGIVDNLLDHLHKRSSTLPNIYNFDKKFVELRDYLSSSLTSLQPSAFANPPHPELLDAVRKGLQGLVTELERVYVNGYDGHIEPAKYAWDQVLSDGLSDYGRNHVKAFLTALTIVKGSFDTLKMYCGKISANDEINKSTTLGEFFADNGYRVSKSGQQNGELQDKDSMRGRNIFAKFMNEIAGAKNNAHLKTCKDEDENELEEKKKIVTKNTINLMDIVNCLFRHLEKYNDVCHFVHHPKPKVPCNVYEMLVWLSGLTHTRVRSAMMSSSIREIFEDKRKGNADENTFEIEHVNVDALTLNTYPKKIIYGKVNKALLHLCSRAYDLLATILGNGDEHTTYACDFSNNVLKLKYPDNGDVCLQMLVDILRNLFPPLRFLQRQCELSTEHGGWQKFSYGKSVKTSKWPCSDHSSDEATCQPKCEPTSPLMSFLNDCLPGHLPHELVSVGCKSECRTCPKGQPGMPCLIPMGFRGFSGSTRTGKELCEAIRKFFANTHVTSFFCFATTPPSTLPEHFSFLMQHFGNWQKVFSGNKHELQSKFETSMYELSIWQVTDQSTLIDALRNIYGSKDTDTLKTSSHPDVKHADLFSLCLPKNTMPCPNKNANCASYLASLYNDLYCYLPQKNAAAYLSWALYLPWDFWKYLNNMYNAFCGIFCQDWGCRRCMRGDKCKRGEHGKTILSCHCSSIASCRGVSPTLYRYGFSFGSASELISGASPKSCHNFCEQMKRVLHSTYFTDLFNKCDEFIFTIRAPFIWLNVALWSLSLLYLLHIMVIRLDLLHIKSHLHSPSSHRIAAQSLLAAARVKALNKVLYLQP